VAAGDDDVPLPRRLDGLELMGVERRDPEPRSAALSSGAIQPGSRPASGSARHRGSRPRVGVGPARLDRAGPARPRRSRLRPSAIAAATRMGPGPSGRGASRPPRRTRRPVTLRGGVAHSRSAAGRSPTSRQERAQEVLSVERDEEGAPEPAELADASEDLQSSRRALDGGRRVEPRSRAICSRRCPRERTLEALCKPPDQVRDRVFVLQRLAVRPVAASMCIST